MRIENLFVKKISRDINGVVKADDLEDRSVWQELDEFVVTKELDHHFREFFTRYSEAINNGYSATASEKNGVWVSGFFGSGKSHFIKVLSYLLDNEDHSYEGETKKAVEFFESKIHDAMLFEDIKKAVASNTDVILFNIDSKADTQAGRDAILTVFLRVLNELQGFSGDFPHIAHMERHLESKGKYGEFQDHYRELTNTEWSEERDAYEFNQDEVIEALSKTIGQSAESCQRWIDSAETNFSLNIQNFAKWVNEYLDAKGPKHRIMFLVDEVGQFIGSDTHLMLNLQTITEELGVVCKGRAWVVVTSQEDIDAVLGEMQTSKANDFSKIQGRFKTRLSLSSANVDEVIQKRLLLKDDAAKPELEGLYESKGDILKNQLSFKDTGRTFKQFQDTADFVRNYPFAPYQFKLLQRIFESIRKAGATGLHLAQGERSLLDAFQSAGKAVSNEEVGVLVPLYLFYPSIESFLDTAVKRTIEHAAENASLEPFDVDLLKVLFLIRYVDEIKGNVDNLITLCMDEIDADRLTIRKKIEESLHRLEKETLISRSGDTYFFLTNEERDINREIKSVEISSGAEAKLLGELIFDDVLGGGNKHRYTANKLDFKYNRVCDMHPIGTRSEGGLLVSVITPLADEFGMYNDAKCVLASSEEEGYVLIRLEDNEILGRELRTWVKTDKYVRTKDDGTLPPSVKRIHRDLVDDNRERRQRLTHLIGEMFVEGKFFVAGQRLEVKFSNPQAVLSEALEYLITNTFDKMKLLQHPLENPLREIQALLRSDNIAENSLNLDVDENNPLALEEVRSYIQLASMKSHQIVLNDLMQNRFALRPYGWAELETLLLLTRLYVAGEIQFVMSGAAIPREKAYEALSVSSKCRKIRILKKEIADPEVVRKARLLGKEVFSEMGPDAEEGLFSFLSKKLTKWQSSLSHYKTLTETGNFPGSEEISEGLSLCNALLAADESGKFLDRFLERKIDLLDLSENYFDLYDFYENQKPTWDKLRSAYTKFEQNHLQLTADESAGPALTRMKEILSAPAPYKMIKEAEGLINSVSQVNDSLISERRQEAVEAIDKHIETVSSDLNKLEADANLRDPCLAPLQKLKTQVEKLESIAHIAQAEEQVLDLKDIANQKIAEFVARQVEDVEPDVETVMKPKVKTICPVKPKSLVKSSYLETQEDIDGFLDALRGKLEDALAQDQRIEIR